ncbi:MAG TPA: DapH/DapD/GlmU-related protein [Armatimonadota bacterium]|nr:DapH/DapD/GlmU-related protein [Armatimonadota bacterium]
MGITENKTEFQARLLDQGKSPLAKYADIAVGRKGLGALIGYDLACWLASPMPGALGYFIRGKVLPRLLSRAGKGLVIGRNVCIRHPGRIHIGKGVVIDDNVVLDAKGDSDEGITIGDAVILGRNTIVSCKGGSIEIGDNTNISANCMLISETRLSIGSNVLIAGMCYIIAGGNHSIERTDIPIIAQPMIQKGGVTVEDNCWLGANVTVLDGVTIGRDSVVGAGSLVNMDIPEFAIAVGAPARVVRNRNGQD